MTKLLRVIGSLLISLGLWFYWTQYQEALEAGLSSDRILQQLQEQSQQQIIATENGEMPVETIDGVDYIGHLVIPSMNLNLPVAATYQFAQLEKTPTRYAGSYYHQDLVVCAHNYPSHFQSLNDIAVGEEIHFKTVTGQTYRYVITNREVIEPTAVDKVFKDRADDQDWDLSLFTCTPTGLARVLVRCRLIELVR